MRPLLLLSLLFTVVLLSACEVLYDIGQDNALKDCERIVDTVGRNECVKRNRKPYGSYEKERQQQLKK
ncbi:hypothetical protein [Roseateles oligotrophus]|uniref:Entry exclusion lipoprotein TrbK n=1 Tax=Roseateles oligotrophus TaxID=1769250 RepID=A0ABT2YK97_9BURK|nr:hypothetical protein [Roseateles oligotrophus]MCV2370490.1 hypothetical protein [Roseateles oligotrophus]